MSDEVIVFDLDDTLFSERDFVVSGLSAVDWLLISQYGRSGFKKTALTLFDEGRRDKLIDHSLHELGMPSTNGLIHALVNVYRSHWPSIKLFEDAFELLQRLKGRHALAVLSDGPLISQVNKARALHTDRWCTVHVFTDLWGREHWKPGEKGFRHIQGLFPEHRQFVYIADNPIKDFVTARALGWKTIRIMRKSGLYSDVQIPDSHLADLTVSTFEDLSSI
jgi:putative hydrolase of the HAD superfamily